VAVGVFQPPLFDYPPQEQERSMPNTRREVVVTDIRMPFWSIVIFMVKFSVASIPAMIILVAFMGAFGAVIVGMVAGLDEFLRGLTEGARPN
jgi:hypothetical protein